jgi:hypothetical protein
MLYSQLRMEFSPPTKQESDFEFVPHDIICPPMPDAVAEDGREDGNGPKQPPGFWPFWRFCCGAWPALFSGGPGRIAGGTMEQAKAPTEPAGIRTP